MNVAVIRPNFMPDLILNESDLGKLRKQCLHHNVFPMFIGHHREQPKKVADVLNKLVSECLEQLTELEDDQVEAVVNALPAGIRNFLLPFPDVVTPDYLERIAENFLASAIQTNYAPISDVLEPDWGDSEVLATCPELSDRIDDDGLLELDASFKLVDGGIQYGEYLLHYHQFLRRGFSSNPNFAFTGTFARYFHNNVNTNKFKIAIDHRRIMNFEDWRQCIECDTWFGPKFDREKLDDPDYLGLTVVGRANPHSIGNYPLIHTEFFWKRNEQRNEIKTFEIEEVSCPTRPIENFNINRYAHAERDMERQTFQHFDGAAKIYRANQYTGRTATNMPNEQKSDFYIKLFRIDGTIDLDDWISLLSMFYKGNEMVIEYLDPDLYNEKFKPKFDALGG